MDIPTWCLVLGAIFLFIAFILSIKIKLIVAYDDSFSAYIRILFFKIPLFPSSKKEKGVKKEKKKKKKATAERAKDKKEKKEKKSLSPSGILKLISLMSDVVLGLLKDFFRKIHFRFIKVHADIGCENASKTAIAYGSVTQSVAYFIELLDNVSNVEVSRASSIDIRANFISQKSWAEISCVLYIRVISILTLGIKAIKAFFIFKNIQEKLLEVDNNGTIKAE
ncbi:MAG: DUF2953 domain-containing protein [Clostridia bacterium]|nr:DUF2953 domain-containing protein [Clostridia bacterium]